MALSHVLRWTDEHGYQPTTVAEAEKLFPYRVHGRGKLLVCGICGQGVTFTYGKVRIRYFRHGEEEQDKECEDRSRAYGYAHSSSSLPSKIENLPFRLIREDEHWRLEIGLLALQETFIKKYADKLICIGNDAGKSFRYSIAERFHPNCLTWLDVGSRPSEYFRLSFSDDSPLPFFWPPQVKGLDNVTFFDVKSGRRLPFFPDLEVNKEYIVIIRGPFDPKDRYDVRVDFISPVKHGWKGYDVYRVKATRFSCEAASFFLRLNANLKRTLPFIFPLWPAVIRTPHLIYHDTDILFILLEGERLETKYYASERPTTSVERKNARLIRFHCGSRKQLVSGNFDSHHLQIGRFTHTLRYDYFIRHNLDMTAPLPAVMITDSKGNEIKDDKYEGVKPGTRFYVQSEFDGEVWLENKDLPLPDRHTLKGGTVLEVEVRTAQTMTIFQGLDRVRTVIFDCPYTLGPQTPDINRSTWTDTQLCRRLKRMEGNDVEDSRALTEFIHYFKGWRATEAWLKQKQAQGDISRRAKAFLHSVIKENKKEKR